MTDMDLAVIEGYKALAAACLKRNLLDYCQEKDPAEESHRINDLDRSAVLATYTEYLGMTVFDMAAIFKRRKECYDEWKHKRYDE